MKHHKLVALLMSAAVIGSMGTVDAFAAQSAVPGNFNKLYSIDSPYENVDWDSYGQYKADFHAHSTNSDGAALMRETVEDHYAKGYDILAMTDHSYLTTKWCEGANGVSPEREAEIESGAGRGGRGMIDIYSSDEQSGTDHINTFFANFNNGENATMTGTIGSVDHLGGISHINHPGRYTGGKSGGEKGIAASNAPAAINKYVDLFRAYKSCVGMEIINKLDNESRCDRILWDNILMKTMPEGRAVWGFANDDTHSLNATGYAFNMMLMPRLGRAETRNAMETGAFYSVSRISRIDGINAVLPDGSSMPGAGNEKTLYLMKQSTPAISEINVDEKDDEITITGRNYDSIEWIANGKVIAEGNSIDLNDHEDEIGSYVRAELKSDTGIAFTQPFGIEEEAPTKIAINSVKNGNGQSTVYYDNSEPSGEGYSVFVSESGKSGTFKPYGNVNFNAKGAHIKKLTNGRKYYVFIARVEDNAVTAVSDIFTTAPYHGAGRKVKKNSK